MQVQDIAIFRICYNVKAKYIDQQWLRRSRKLDMTNEKAWDYAIGLIKVDGLEPTDDFKKYIELEKKGLATTQDLKKYLDKKYTVKANA